MTKLKAVRILSWSLIALIFLGITVSVLWLQSAQPTSQLSPELAAIGGDFTAVNQNSQTVTQKELLGKPTLIFFGYTFCPDVCPTTLANLSIWLAALGRDADQVNTVFVTLDPKRDTPKTIRNYLTSFDKHIRGWVPSEAEVQHIAKEYHLYMEKTGSGDDYLINHTADIYLFNRAGQFTGTISPQEGQAVALEKIKLLLKK